MPQKTAIDLNLTFTALTDYQCPTLGEEYVDPKGAIYKFVKGAATIALYEWCILSKDTNYTVILLDTDTATSPGYKVGALAVPQHKALTSSLYGWVFIGNGIFTAKVAASCVQDVALYATSTGGVADDSATTSLIAGASLITTVTGAAAASCHAAGRLMSIGV